MARNNSNHGEGEPLEMGKKKKKGGLLHSLFGEAKGSISGKKKEMLIDLSARRVERQTRLAELRTQKLAKAREAGKLKAKLQVQHPAKTGASIASGLKKAGKAYVDFTNKYEVNPEVIGGTSTHKEKTERIRRGVGDIDLDI